MLWSLNKLEYNNPEALMSLDQFRNFLTQPKKSILLRLYEKKTILKNRSCLHFRFNFHRRVWCVQPDDKVSDEYYLHTQPNILADLIWNICICAVFQRDSLYGII